MRLKQIGKNLSVFLLLGVFFYSISVKEFHYAFSARYHTVINDHCDHHIHPTKGSDDDCVICKMDVATVLHTSQNHYSFIVVFLTRPSVVQPEGALFAPDIPALYLRGPPQTC